jgi:predicted esterase
MKTSAILSLLSLITSVALGQTRIDSDFPFQSDPAKKYSIYVPSGYDANTPHRLMVGFHPFNTNRWDAESWCDTLIVFAETNNLLLVCPDGGPDGQVDDAIDTAFTSALMDSMALWYHVDAAKTYAMGFSWGGKTTYTYGLSNHTKFGGYLVTGAAVSGTSEVTEPLQQNAEDKPVYIIHGLSDSPNTRFYPVRDSLISKGAIVETNLMNGVGHTIDYPNRNAILSVGYQWMDSVNCAGETGVGVAEVALSLDRLLAVYPTVLANSQQLKLDYHLENEGVLQISVYDLTGKFVKDFSFVGTRGENHFLLNLRTLASGTFVIEMRSEAGYTTKKIIIK